MSVTPWFAQYDADVAPTVAPYPDKTLLDYLADLAHSHGSSPALIFKGSSLSYGSLESQSDTYAERELELTLGSTEAMLVVALTPFYNRIKTIQARTKVRRVVATSIKEYLPPLLRVLFTIFKEKKDGHRIT